MKRLFSLLPIVMVILISLLLNACATPVTIPTPAPPPPTPPSPMPPPSSSPPLFHVDHNPHCDNVLDVNFDNAYEEAHNQGKYFLWTISMNFDTPDPKACFRLYLRHDNATQFEAIDGGGITIDSCLVVGQVDINSGKAQFNQEGFIVCPDIAVKRLVQEAIEVARAPLNSPDLESLLSDVGFDDGTGGNQGTMDEYELLVERDFHKNSTFTIAAVGSVSLDVENQNPVVYYEAIDTPELSASMQLPVYDGGQGGFLSIIEDREYRSDIGVAECTFDGNQYLWWTDFSGKLQFAKWLLGSSAPELCDAIEITPTPTAPLSSTIDVWTGEANLVIGCQPTGDGGTLQEICSSLLNGTLDGIIIDPLDSKPQIGGG